MGRPPADHHHPGGNSPASPPPLDLVCFSLIVDDIVKWDGRTSMANVGGGGPQVLWGFKAAAAALDGDRDGDGGKRGATVALAAGVGEDLPPSVSDWLSGPCLGADLSGLQLTLGLPTPRAWQILEKDGRRTQVWRCDASDALYRQLRPPFESLPERLRTGALAYHIGLHAAHPPKSLLRAMREAVDVQRAQKGGEEEKASSCLLLSAETYTRCEDGPLTPAQLRALLEPLDVFSPNEEEAASMLGVRLRHSRGDDDFAGKEEEEAEAAEEAERRLVDALLDAASAGGRGSRPLTVTLRRGGQGALAKRSDDSAAVRVPACQGLSLVDPVGCGNAFCGGFLAAVQRGARLREAAAWGCAAGGTMAEHDGVPRAALGELAPVVARRARELAARVKGGGPPGLGVPRRLL